VLRRFKYEDDPLARAVTVDEFPGETELGEEGTTTDRQSSRVTFDALGRPRFTLVELGADYDGRKMVGGLVQYNALGQVAFSAAPFSTSDPQYLPELTDLYGTTPVYDRRGRLIREVTAYGPQPALTDTSIGDGAFVRSYEYDYQAGQLRTAVTGADENDPSSPFKSFIDESWKTALGREVRRVRRDPWRVRLDQVDQDWDRLGRMVATRRYRTPMSNSGVVVWSAEYDSLGRQLSATEPGMATVYTAYDDLGHDVKSWWGDGSSTRMRESQYDGFGRQTAQILSLVANGNTHVEARDFFHYDELSGDVAQPETDVSGRLSWVQTIGVGAVYYGYDNLGRANSSTFVYDGHDKPVRQKTQHSTGGRLEELRLTTAYTEDLITYEYDSAERLRAVMRGQENLAEAELIDDKGRYQRVRYGNDVLETFDYAHFAREEQIAWGVHTSSGSYQFENLELDAAGRLKWERRTTPAGPATYYLYEHDALGRLGGVAKSTTGLPQVEQYTHDPLGNLVSRDGTTGISALAYNYDTVDLDKLCRAAAPGTIGPCQFQYDGAGNVGKDLSGSELREFQYDPSSRIVGVSRGQNKVAFDYGPLGRAHTKVTTPAAIKEFWHFGLVEERWLPEYKHVERRIPGPLGTNISLRAEVANENVVSDHVVYAHGDGRANHVFTDDQGAVVQAATYGTYGQTSTTGNASSITQTDDLWNGGDNFPEVGVVILGPRAYDPDLGRFLQRDPIAITSRASTANPYGFAFSNPVDFADPTGLSPNLSGYNLNIYQQTGPSQSSSSRNWRLGMLAGLALANAAMSAFSSDRAADPLAGIMASLHSPFGGFFNAMERSLAAAPGGGDCDNMVCSAVDGVVGLYGFVWVDVYGSIARGKFEALASMGETGVVDGLQSTAASGLGALGPIALKAWHASEFVKAAPGMAAAIQSDPAGALCGGSCDLESYGRLEARVGVLMASGGGEAIDAIGSAILQRFVKTALGRMWKLRTLTRKQAEMTLILRSGNDVSVDTAAQARALLDNMPDVSPWSSGRFDPMTPAPRGTYRGDLINTSDPTSPWIHPPGTSKHGHRPHYNIYFHDGEKAVIWVGK
jgi:RHS repeat-associated protein